MFEEPTSERPDAGPLLEKVECDPKSLSSLQRLEIKPEERSHFGSKPASLRDFRLPISVALTYTSRTSALLVLNGLAAIIDGVQG